jgi:outer membrane protein insertion porin family
MKRIPHFGWYGLALLLLGIGEAGAAQTNYARFKISGDGFLGNRQLKRTIATLRPEKERPLYYDANFIEDAALLIFSDLRRGGYLKPHLVVQVTLDDNSTRQFEWAESGREPLPRPLKAHKVRFRVFKGRLYLFESIQFEGLQHLTLDQARAFFVETGTLVPLRSNRIYTPERLRQGLDNLKETLERRGYASNKVEVLELRQDDTNGNVSVRIGVEEGSQFIVRSIRKELYLETTNRLENAVLVTTNSIFSPVWVQDLKRSLKTVYFHQGYPDCSVDVTITNATPESTVKKLDLLVKVFTGPLVALNNVKFEGYKKTRLSTLQRRVRLEESNRLDRVRVEEGRYRLARLGIFDSVELRYDLIDEHERDVVYTVKEGKRLDFSILAGWGSYEMLRGGVELEQFNMFGLAHHSRLRLIQSFRSSSADYNYNVPDFFGHDIDLFLIASGLRRQEVSFVREEYGGGLGARKYFKATSSDLSLRYQYQVLNAADTAPGVAVAGLTNASAGTVIAELRHDRRDNPLYPRHGYKVFSHFELGSSYLGGDANYQRYEVATSWVLPLYNGAWMNFGLSHGLVFPMGSREQDLPFDRRFFPGGENSIRGYQEGGASPRDATGQFVGAESCVLGNIEFEQSLTRSISVVLFSDSLGTARDISNYPFNQGLFSVGGGLRWRTLVGPIRLEYGYNLNPRPSDPSGTLHFSMGFPF